MCAASDLKAKLRVLTASSDAGQGPAVAEELARVVSELEPLCEVQRCATSPLLDGRWETVFASDRPRWAQRRRMLHVIEHDWLRAGDTWDEARGLTQSPGSPGVLSGPRGQPWDDVSGGRGAYVQRVRSFVGTAELRARYTWLGGDGWNLEFVSRAWLLCGIPLWRRGVRAPQSDADLDHGARPTYVCGEFLVMRSPAVRAGDVELRPGRLYLLRRLKNHLWQGDEDFKGLSDRFIEP